MNLNNMNIAGMVALLVLVVILVVFWPLIIIASLNSLFPLLSIPYNFYTWLSICVLNLSTFGGLNTTLVQIKNKL
jgi:hypothetical protein